MSVRKLMAGVAACALLFFFLRTRHTWGYLRHVGEASVSAWGPLLFLALILVPRLRSRMPPGVVRVLGAVSPAVSFYFLWAFFLAMSLRNGEEPPYGWPRGFPFPDRPLEVLAECFALRHPASPGTIKLHGELPWVLYFVGRLTILSTIAAGFFVALLVRPRPAKNEA